MKNKLSILALVISGTLLVSCEKENGGLVVDRTVNDAFRNRYSSATRAEGEFKQGYYVVDFWLNGVEVEAWFDSQGVWHMSETDVKFVDLPEAVRTAFFASEWAAARIEDVDKLEYPDREISYVIEIEQAGVDYDLWFSPDGVLVKAISENGTSNGTGNSSGTVGYGPSSILPAVKEFIAQKYPGARIIDVETERTTIEVDIVDGRTPREVVFTRDGEWSHTETEIRKADVPTTVLNALSTSPYASWHIDDISFFETTGGEYYLIEVESGNREARIKIDTLGNIL